MISSRQEVNPRKRFGACPMTNFTEICAPGNGYPMVHLSGSIDELRKGYPPRHQQGFTVFCTGFSGAGKSTIAKVLYARFLEMGADR